MSEIQTVVTTKKNFILRGDWFDFYFARYFSVKNKTIREWFNEKKRRVKDDKITYRIINHWSSAGIIDDNRPKGKGWRSFSTMEVIWINVVYEMRRFGFPIEKILLVKKSLMRLSDKIEDSLFPILELYTHFALTKKEPVYILVSDNGDTEIASEDEYNLGIDYNTLENHLKLSLNTILQKLFPSADLSPEQSSTFKLNDDELELLFMVRTEQYESINVIKRNGKIDRIDKTEYLEADRKLSSILSDGNYQKIEVFQRGGEVIQIKRTIQRKTK